MCPTTREQGCWCHKLVNVLDQLPPRLQPRAKRALHEMMYAARRADCEAAKARFAAEYQAKYPKAVKSLTANWDKEYAEFRHRDLTGQEYVYVWVDGIHFNIRLENDRLCTLVMIGARPNGEKDLLAVEDGYRESAESWKSCYAISSGAA